MDEHGQRRFGEALAASAEAARAAWPDLAVDQTAFVAHLRRHLGPDERTALAALGGWHVADLYFAHACALACPPAVRTLERKLAERAPQYLARVGGAQRAFVDETRQVLLEKLLVAAPGEEPKIASYSGRGALEGWLRIACVNTALKLLARPEAGPRADDGAAARAVDPSPDPELALVKHQHRAEFEVALREAFAALDPKARNVLRLHFVDGLNIDAIGAAYGTHRATAARWLQQARQDVLEGIRKTLRDRLRLTPEELQSMVNLVQSRLESSVRALLATK